jgi:hypothetical protein
MRICQYSNTVCNLNFHCECCNVLYCMFALVKMYLVSGLMRPANCLIHVDTLGLRRCRFDFYKADWFWMFVHQLGARRFDHLILPSAMMLLWSEYYSSWMNDSDLQLRSSSGLDWSTSLACWFCFHFLFHSCSKPCRFYQGPVLRCLKQAPPRPASWLLWKVDMAALVLVVALHSAPTLQHMAHHDFITPCHPLVFSSINPLIPQSDFVSCWYSCMSSLAPFSLVSLSLHSR